MQVVRGNIDVKEIVHFGRQNYIRFNQDEKQFEFYTDGSTLLAEIGTTGIVAGGGLSISGDLTVDTSTLYVIVQIIKLGLVQLFLIIMLLLQIL